MGDCGQMGKQIEQRKGLLSRLLHNQAGNVMAIVAAAIIPLAALIGGGLDMSRAYMARARLQQACDAAALAGRRAMTTSSMTDANKAEAKKFFDFNFPQGTFQAETFTPVIQSKPSETTTVQVSATTTMPTTVMKIFNYTTLPLEVTCEARFDIGNTDVMLVLDTTGSMAQSISDGNGGTTTRLAALKQAVKDFYDTLGAGSDTTGRIRYGFMPYSSTVNVGYQLPASYLVGGTTGETWTYNTRWASYYWETGSNDATCYKRNGSSTCHATAQNALDATGGTDLSPSACTTWQTASASTTGTAPSDTTRTVYSYGGWNNSTTNAPSGSNNRECVRKEVTTSKTYATSNSPGEGRTRYTNWTYADVAFDTTDFVAGNSVQNPAYEWGTNSTWAGCIEERSTDNTITASSSTSSIPSTAYDLQIDTLPINTDTKWRPHWPEVEFDRSGNNLNSSSRISGGWNACPSQSRRLTSYADRTSTPTGQSSSFNSYVDSLVAVGGTYHDIGMIWGARFLSPTGIFAADNSSAPNGFNISRHIVFMTDGDMSAYDAVYGAYGYQLLDGRVAATNTDNTGLTAIHNRRLEMLCNAVKGKGITVWVIGFRNQSEGDIQAPLQGCASSSNHWMMAYTAASLTQKFKDIAKNIGGLRLSQ
ncbi:pilus assembly protein TadG [Sphingobium terrigena]|uniref:Pilus assembly protein TadG n=1 Tax=Sphingobium terrigena TaxID=2304063 RepID=A0A418YW54_9SPHN|nr:pilus assembly protein TadG-related protein [Sphingobium terrigena]RJG56647.1 pilus assembly protein TadG [Sphingobium terrigena]